MRKKKDKKVSQDVLEDVVKITEIEALKFGKLDAEIRNAAQGIQIAIYRKQELRSECESRCKLEDDQIASLNAIIRKLKPEYELLIEEIIKKYKIKDKEHMSIDPDTRIVREI